jgi:hypothetical protein
MLYKKFYGHSIHTFHGKYIADCLSKINERKKGKAIGVELFGTPSVRDAVLIMEIAKKMNVSIFLYVPINEIALEVKGIYSNVIVISTEDTEEYSARKIELLYCNLESDSSYLSDCFSYLKSQKKNSFLANYHKLFFALSKNNSESNEELRKNLSLTNTEEYIKHDSLVLIAEIGQMKQKEEKVSTDEANFINDIPTENK